MRVHRLALLGDRRLKVQAAVAASLVYWTSKPALAEVTACARFQSAGLPGGIHQSIILFYTSLE
jgi:hypothetical protein